MNLQRSFYKIVRAVSKNLPTILTGISAFGVFATGYFSAKAAHENSKTIDTTFPEYEKEEWKEAVINYIPAIASATITVGTMVMANKINRSRIRGLTIAYTNLNTRFNKYKIAAMGTLGAEGYKKLMEAEAEKDIKQISEPIQKEENEYIFYDYFTRQDFLAKLEDVISAQYELNKLFTLRGYATLNDYLKLLKLPISNAGDILAWSLDSGMEFYGYEWIDFLNTRHESPDGSIWYTIFMPFEPTIDDYYHYASYDALEDAGNILDEYHEGHYLSQDDAEELLSQKLHTSN